MRDYGVVSPKFWIGETGKQLRGDAQAQVLALYLMTSPHATMTGVYHCPVLYMAHETGLGMEGASKALARLIEVGFCTFDEASEYVFVTRMAAFQIGEQLKPDDKRVIGVGREVDKMPEGPVKSRFLAIYSVAFNLPSEQKKASPSKAPSKPHRSQEQEQDQEQEKKEQPAAPARAVADLPAGFLRFWSAWPANPRKGSRGKCLSEWKKAKAESVADQIVSHVESLKTVWAKDNYAFAPAPLVYLNQRRWEGAESGEATARELFV